MNFFDILVKTLATPSINTPIIASLGIILLGYFCRKRNIFNDSTAKVLTKVVLTVSLPPLAFNAFMQDVKPETFTQGMNVLIWGIAVYIVLIFATLPIFAKYKGDEKDTLRILAIFGSTTFFGLPIVQAIWGQDGALFGNIFNIGYRIFLYSYAYIKMTGLKFTSKNLKQIFLNPIVLATFIGLIIWIFQKELPQVAISVKDTKTGEMVLKNYAFLRIDQTLPQLYKIFTYLAGLASPLAWLAIGSTLGQLDFKSAVSDKTTWYYTFVKIILVPLLNVVVLVLLKVTGILPVNAVALGAIVVMMATPPATVAVSYAINFDKKPVLASNASLLGTIAAVIATPIWIVVVQVLQTMGIF